MRSWHRNPPVANTLDQSSCARELLGHPSILESNDARLSVEKQDEAPSSDPGPTLQIGEASQPASQPDRQTTTSSG